MLNSIRKFSKTFLAKVILTIVIIPFVFWGMGGVFNSGNTNSLAKINNVNISTEDFIDHINNLNIDEEIIREKINDNILEEILTVLISKELLALEIKDLNIFISDKTLVEKIMKNKKMHKNPFSGLNDKNGYVLLLALLPNPLINIFSTIFSELYKLRIIKSGK